MTSLLVDFGSLTARPQAVSNMGMVLGEGPIWVEAANSFYFTDIVSRKIHAISLDTRVVASYDPPQDVGFILPCVDGDLVLGYPRALGRFSPRSCTFSDIRALEMEPVGNRLNDGCVAPDGTVWFGSMDKAEKNPVGLLYHGFADKGAPGGVAVRQFPDGFTVSNGPTVSPDGKILYACDSAAQVIYAYDVAAGALSNRRVFAKLDQGHPDGVTADSQGNVWCCVWAGSRIECFNPEGEIIETYPMPTTNVTKLAFGGADMRTALVTTAARDLTPLEKSRQPSAGGIFMFRAPWPGQKNLAFKNA